MSCRKGCTKFDFVRYMEKFDYHWPNSVREHWPKKGEFRCRTCGEKRILPIKPPVHIVPANSELYREVNAAMRANGLPEYEMPKLPTPIKPISKMETSLSKENRVYLAETFKRSQETAQAILKAPDISQLSEKNGEEILGLIKKEAERIYETDKEKGVKVASYRIGGKVYFHDIFPQSDDRVEVTEYSPESGDDKGRLIFTFNSSTEILDAEGKCIGSLRMHEDHVWLVDNEGNYVEKYLSVSNPDAYIESEVHFVKSYFNKKEDDDNTKETAE